MMLKNIFQLWVQKVFPSPHVEQCQFLPKVLLVMPMEIAFMDMEDKY
jgi:hypothetical protein